MHVELVRTVTRDGLRLDGALIEARGVPPVEGPHPTAAVFLHGVAGNFYTSSTFEPLVSRLPGIGIAALLVNTRGHDSVFGATVGSIRRRFGAAYETVDDCRHDTAAWVQFLSSRGHQRVTVIGHSLGAVKAVYSLAHEPLPQVAAVVAASPPRLSYAAFRNSPESSVFWESMQTAEQMVTAGQGDELFTSKYPFPLLITAAAYIDKYGPAERYNLLNFAAEVQCPTLYTYGSKELATGGVPFSGMPEALAALPNPERRTTAIVEGADHFYAGVSAKLADAVTEWLTGRPL